MITCSVVDEWEIIPGQDFVTQINRGLALCDVGLVFLSKASIEGKWQQAEISALTTMAVEEKKPLIPVLLDQDTPVPALLRSRSREEATMESDLDVLVVVGCLDHETEKYISECAWEAGFPWDIIVMPIAISLDTLKNSPVRESVFIKTVYREGIVV